MTTKSLRPNTVLGIAHQLRDKLRPNGNSKPNMSEKGKAARRSELRRQEKLVKGERLSRESQSREERLRLEEELARLEEDAESLSRWGMAMDVEDLPVHPDDLSTIEQITKLPVGSKVAFRARIHTQRRLSPKLDFLLFRDQTHSIQGVLADASPHMSRWVQRLSPESLVYVSGTLKEPQQEVKSATEHHIEVNVYSTHLLNPANELPWDNYEPPEALHTRMQARVLDVRHPSNVAIFRVRSVMVSHFRRTLEDDGFLEIQTPKLQPAATESGSSVFKVNYFGRKAFLAQSPQLSKQMAISADLRRVFEVSLGAGYLRDNTLTKLNTGWPSIPC
jgi:lysyl-tRNA synthetase class II